MWNKKVCSVTAPNEKAAFPFKCHIQMPFLLQLALAGQRQSTCLVNPVSAPTETSDAFWWQS